GPVATMRCWLDIGIGDAAKHAADTAAFKRTEAYFESIKSQYGWTGSLQDQGSEELELLEESYASDSKRSAEGPALVKAPAPLVAGRVSVELDPSAAPKACENFRCLCTGEKGKCKSSGKALHYRGVPFHRIVTGFVCQGGDIVRGDGSGKSSIYGKAFADEKGGLAKNHESVGVLGMANSGKNSNTSQFYFTLGAAPACNGKHVVLGKVVQGEEVLKRIDREAASPSGEPRVAVWVEDCGVCA
ncbi:cyclophilin type peptidyl-prolyl cis-trans isomerase, partial [Helicosporidium sp. ATCC 50920]